MRTPPTSDSTSIWAYEELQSLEAKVKEQALLILELQAQIQELLAKSSG